MMIIMMKLVQKTNEVRSVDTREKYGEFAKYSQQRRLNLSVARRKYVDSKNDEKTAILREKSYFSLNSSLTGIANNVTEIR